MLKVGLIGAVGRVVAGGAAELPQGIGRGERHEGKNEDDDEHGCLLPNQR